MPETVTLKILYIEIQFTTGRKKRKTAAIHAHLDPPSSKHFIRFSQPDLIATDSFVRRITT